MSKLEEAVKDVMEDMCDENMKRRAAGIKKLSGLCAFPENRANLVSRFGILGPLLVAIKDGGEDMAHACASLHFLALEEQNVVPMVFQFGVVGVLADLLNDESIVEGTLVYVCAALNSLSISPKTRASMVQDYDVLKPLLVLAQRTDHAAQVYALGTLHWLSHEPTNGPIFAAQGIVPTALRLVVSDAPKVRDQALGVLASLALHAYSKPGDYRVIEELRNQRVVEVIRPLVQLQQGLSIVANVTTANIIGRDESSQWTAPVNISDIVQLLVAVLNGERVAGLAWPLRVPLIAVRNLMVNHDYRQQMANLNIVHPLCRVVRAFLASGQHVDVAHLAAIALLDLSLMYDDDDDLRHVWKDIGGLVTTLDEFQAESRPDHADLCAALLSRRLKATAVPLPPKPTNHVLVLAADADAGCAAGLSDCLRDLGYVVCPDLPLTDAGQYADALTLAIHNAIVVIVCVSQAFNESGLCHMQSLLVTRHAHVAAAAVKVVHVVLEEHFRPSGWLVHAMSSLWYPAWDRSRMAATAHSLSQHIAYEYAQAGGKLRKPLSELTVEDVGAVLEAVRLDKYVAHLVSNCVDGATLVECKDEDDIMSLGVSLRPHARKLLKLVRRYEREGVMVGGEADDSHVPEDKDAGGGGEGQVV